MRAAPAASSSPRDTTDDARDLRVTDAGWVLQWTALTVIAGGLATILDAVLLQYRRSYFTGGFLARDYVTGPIEAVAFLAGSLFTDVAAIGLVVWAGLWLFGRFAITRHLALAGALVLALVPASGSAGCRSCASNSIAAWRTRTGSRKSSSTCRPSARRVTPARRNPTHQRP